MAVLLILYLDNAKANEILSNTKVTLTYLFGHNTCGIEGHDAKECRKVCSHCGKFGHGFDTCDTIKRLEVRALRGSRLMSVSYVEKEIVHEKSEFKAGQKDFPTLGKMTKLSRSR